ncbi:hypothetical protein GOODEAATRI_034169, partial [Goodea atripinnis]
TAIRTICLLRFGPGLFPLSKECITSSGNLVQGISKLFSQCVSSPELLEEVDDDELRGETESSDSDWAGRTTVIKSASSTKRRSSYVSTPMDFKCSSRMFLVTAGSSGRTSIMASCKKVQC